MKKEPTQEGFDGSELRRYQELAVRHQDAFDHIAALDRALSLKEVSNPMADLFEIALPYIESVIVFNESGFFECDPETLEFQMRVCRPNNNAIKLQKVVDWAIDQGHFAWALKQLRPLVLDVPELSMSLLLHAVVTPARKFGMFAAFRALREISESDFLLPTLTLMLQRTAHALEVQDLYRRIQRHNRELESVVEQRTKELRRLAITDPLTGIYNRRHFFDVGSNMFYKAGTKSTPLAVIMIDIDHFKEINDTLGHGIGDRVIQNVAHLLMDKMPKDALYARLGGEEFGVLLENEAADRACAITNDLRIAVQELRSPSFTLSAGVTSVDSADVTLEESLHRADTALYEAKKTGRNKVVCYNAQGKVSS